VQEEATPVALKEGPVLEVLMQEKTTKVLAQQGPAKMWGGTVLVRDMPLHVEADVVATLLGAEGVYVSVG
jgi:hypothetical protein